MKDISKCAYCNNEIDERNRKNFNGEPFPGFWSICVPGTENSDIQHGVCDFCMIGFALMSIGLQLKDKILQDAFHCAGITIVEKQGKKYSDAEKLKKEKMK